MAEVLNGIDLNRCRNMIETVRTNPEFGRTMWRARAVWQGGYKSECETRGFRFVIDEPVGMGGTDEGPNPVEYVLGAYGGCLVVGYAMNAALMGIELKKIEVEIEGDIDTPHFLGLESEGRPGFSHIRVRVFLKSPATMDRLEELHERVVSTSPVGLTLRHEVKVDVELVKRRIA